MTPPLLETVGLGRDFVLPSRRLFGPPRRLHAVADVSFRLRRGEILGVVGESGCGKSTLGRMLIRLLDPTSGTVRLNGTDLSSLRGTKLTEARRQMQMVFQDPFGSLNPRMKVRDLVLEPLQLAGVPRAEQLSRLDGILTDVGLSPDHADRFAHQFSGGQRQRIGLARALAPSPQMIVCDEPVSALDVSVQAQILNLLQDLRDRHGLAYVFISHDLGVVRHLADRVMVMYLGRVVETAPAARLFAAPRHPYTRALLAAAPGRARAAGATAPVPTGELPSPLDPPPGCAFHPRCPLASDICRTERPRLSGDGEQEAACHHA